MKKNAEELKQEFLDFEISQPLVKKNQMALNPKNKKGFNIKEYGKKFISTFLIFTGAYLISKHTTVKRSLLESVV